MTSHKLSAFVREHRIFGSILIMAALHGLLYVFLIPPWQHYDEPNHFEKVWLSAHLDHLPNEADYSPKLSRQVLKSMIRRHFYSEQNTPDIGPQSGKLTIPGYSQLSEPPLYYLIASLPLHLIPNRGVDAQLYAARLASLGFFMLTMLIGYGVACELSPKGHPLRWMLPLSLALLPSFVDLMTMVNNDVAAIFASSAFLYLSLRLIRRGFSLIDFLALCLVSGLVILSKITAITVFVTLPFTLLFSTFRNKNRPIAWGASVLILVAALVLIVRWDDAFAWYRNTSQPGPTRVRSEQAPWGDFAFSLDTAAVATPKGFPLIYQNMPVSKTKTLEQKAVTFGYWVWAEQEVTVNAPLTLRVQGGSFFDTVDITRTPKFHALTTTIPVGTNRLWVDFNPHSGQIENHLYYDGLALVEGEFPVDQPPVFDNPRAETGAWGGRSFVNLLINPSAEIAGPRASPLIDDLGARFLPDSTRPSLVLASLVDPNGTVNLYPPTARHLFQTFWARFGWGNVGLIGGNTVYVALYILSLLLLLFSLVRAVRLRKCSPWDVIFVFGLITVLSTLMALTRAVLYLAGPGFYIATARYFYPVVIPWMLLFSVGWLEMEYWLSKLIFRPGQAHRIAQPENISLQASSFPPAHFSWFLAFFSGLSILALVSIIHFFY